MLNRTGANLITAIEDHERNRPLGTMLVLMLSHSLPHSCDRCLQYRPRQLMIIGILRRESQTVAGHFEEAFQDRAVSLVFYCLADSIVAVDE